MSCSFVFLPPPPQLLLETRGTEETQPGNKGAGTAGNTRRTPGLWVGQVRIQGRGQVGLGSLIPRVQSCAASKPKDNTGARCFLLMDPGGRINVGQGPWFSKKISVPMVALQAQNNGTRCVRDWWYRANSRFQNFWHERNSFFPFVDVHIGAVCKFVWDIGGFCRKASERANLHTQHHSFQKPGLAFRFELQYWNVSAHVPATELVNFQIYSKFKQKQRKEEWIGLLHRKPLSHHSHKICSPFCQTLVPFLKGFNEHKTFVLFPLLQRHICQAGFHSGWSDCWSSWSVSFAQWLCSLLQFKAPIWSLNHDWQFELGASWFRFWRTECVRKINWLSLHCVHLCAW